MFAFMHNIKQLLTGGRQPLLGRSQVGEALQHVAAGIRSVAAEQKTDVQQVRVRDRKLGEAGKGVGQEEMRTAARHFSSWHQHCNSKREAAKSLLQWGTRRQASKQARDSTSGEGGEAK